MKKTVQKLALVLAACLTLFGFETGAAELDSESGVDVAIVIDTSGSMKKTDPSRISIEASKLFIDMLETTGSGAGIVPFSDTLGDVVDVTPINSVGDKESLKAVIDSLQYTGDTDIGLAVKKGCELLKGTENGNKKALLFFTDGNIDLGNKRLRTDDLSLQDLRDAVADASADGIPMYTIGLNANGSVDKNLLSDMATQTGGRSYVVESASDLPGIFNEIFADFINSNIVSLGEVTLDGIHPSEISFEIPNESVLEANVIMLSTLPLTDVSMHTPDGSLLAVDGNKLTLSRSKQYHMLKLLMPAAGNWKLEINGSAGCQVHVNLIFNYKVSLAAETELLTAQDGSQSIRVTAVLKKEEQPLTDQALYQAFTGKVRMVKEDEEWEFPMELSGTTFIAEIPVQEPGEYQLYARVDSDTLYRESSSMQIEIAGETESQTEKPIVKEENNAPVSHRSFSDILPLILVSVLLIAIIAGLIWMKRILAAKNAQWFGKIRWTVLGGKPGISGMMREQSRDMGYERGTVTLDRIIQDPSASNMDLKKISLSMNNKTNSSIILRSSAKNCDVCPGFGGAPTKQVELNSGEFVMIVGHSPTGDITVKVTYTVN